ncbi:brassinosteroid-responsive RING-H2 [Hibiscus trionum]|uniref:Brassinosteroid-responsive RING-H2 n=1 Tax=Hibiscus trionum TaxID=183268 RepID=A0A9W7IWV1_HIBTR|nr:brassinosteroid-responsive RING-H2 [Hibiscus trionum]
MGFPTIGSDFTLPEPVLHVISVLNFILSRLGLSDFLQPVIVWPENPPRTTSESAPLIRRKSLPVVKFEELVVGKEPPENCAVCLYEYEGGEEIRLLKNCRHVFHVECLDRWMDHDQYTCPLCRTPIFNNNFDGKKF